jgi:hypothetical protein
MKPLVQGLQINRIGSHLIKKYAFLDAKISRLWDPQLAAIYRALEPQETLGIAVRDAMFIGGTKRELFQEISSSQHGAIGIVR